MFENLPTVADVKFDENDNQILPVEHLEAEFDEAASIVERLDEKYGSYGCIDPTQIDGDAYRYIWQMYIEEDAKYIRPDVLVAAVHYIVETVVSDILDDPWTAIKDYWGGETELDKKIKEIAKQVAKIEGEVTK